MSRCRAHPVKFPVVCFRFTSTIYLYALAGIATLAVTLTPFYAASMDVETIRQKLADLDEAGRIRVLSRAIWLLDENHKRLVKRVEQTRKLTLQLMKRVERNRKLTLQTASVAAKGTRLAIQLAKAAFPGLFKRKRKRMKLARYFVGARLTHLQQEVMSHLYEDGWGTAQTARYMRRHPKVIYEHKRAAEMRIKRFFAVKGIKASDIGLGRK